MFWKINYQNIALSNIWRPPNYAPIFYAMWMVADKRYKFFVEDLFEEFFFFLLDFFRGIFLKPNI